MLGTRLRSPITSSRFPKRIFVITQFRWITRKQRFLNARSDFPRLDRRRFNEMRSIRMRAWSNTTWERHSISRLQGYSCVPATHTWMASSRSSISRASTWADGVAPGLFAHTLGGNCSLADTRWIPRGWKRRPFGRRWFCSGPSYATTRLPPQDFYGHGIAWETI